MGPSQRQQLGDEGLLNVLALPAHQIHPANKGSLACSSSGVTRTRSVRRSFMRPDFTSLSFARLEDSIEMVSSIDFMRTTDSRCSSIVGSGNSSDAICSELMPSRVPRPFA